MLLATYAFLTLTVEQTCERNCIQAVQQALAKALDPLEFDAATLNVELEKLITIAESTHWRRLEYCLIPAMRAASSESSFALRAIETLGQAGIAMLPLIRTNLCCPSELSQPHIAAACRTVQEYCQNLLDRLACEEDQILPLAQRLLDGEAWFRVGLEFLHQDALQDRLTTQPAQNAARVSHAGGSPGTNFVTNGARFQPASRSASVR